MNFETSIRLGESILDKLGESDKSKVLEVNSDNGAQLTVEEARIRTISITKNLMGIKIKKGDIVVIYSKPNEKVTPVVFACLLVGAAVHFLEMSLQKSVIGERIRMLNPTLIIYELEYKLELYKALERLWPKNLLHVLCLDSDILNHTLDANEYFQLPLIGDPKELSAILMLTTDSTGSQKVVKVTHAMLARDLYNFRHLSAESTMFCSNQLQFTNQALLIMLPVFLSTRLIYSGYIEFEQNASEKTRQIIDTFGVSYFFDIPESFLEIIKSAEQSKDPKSLASLKIVYIFGELLMDSFDECVKRIVPNCSVIKINSNSIAEFYVVKQGETQNSQRTISI